MTNNQNPDEEQIITQEGYDKLKKELDYLKSERRHEIADRIERAKELGDLSENAEYSEAKEEQAFNEGKIIELQELVKKLKIVENGSKGGTVELGSTVAVQCPDDKEKEFTLVSFNEVDPANNKISNESPIGQSLIGHKAGDEVIVPTPSGEVKYKILKVK